ncbi:MAG: hypothetical protein RIM99_06780 [Cyclobacteriaceae bacterium]
MKVLKLIFTFLFIFLISPRGIAQTNAEILFHEQRARTKKILASEGVSSISVTRTSYFTSNINLLGDMSSDSIVYSKDGSYYRKINFPDGKTWTTEYKNEILKVNGEVLNRIPNFLKNDDLFYFIFRIPRYDSCFFQKSYHCDCTLNDKKFELHFNENQELIKIISSIDTKEFSEFDEVFGLSYPTRIKGLIESDNITSDVKITSLTVFKK